MSQLSGMGALGVGFVAMLISIMLALPVTVLLTLAVIRRFRKRVADSMQATIGASERVDLIEEPAFSTTLGELKIKQIAVTKGLNHRSRGVSLVRVARRREWRLATIFSMAACAHPFILAAIIAFSTYNPHAQRHIVTFVLLSTSFFFITGTPVALAATMILTKQLRFLIVAVLTLIAAFFGLGWALRPDPDGRYRIEDFFCHLDTWQMTAAHLAKEADVVLMDLRGFSSANRGCTLEIAMLVNSVSVNRLVFVVDNSTDREYLAETIQGAWSALPSTSPNLGMDHHQVCLFQAKGHLGTAETLLGLLCEKVMT